MMRPLIVLVEDETIIASMLQEVLSDEGYQVRTASDTSSARSLIWEQRPDLVILDLRLETANAGWQLLQAMRADDAIKEVPVLVCSADVFFIAEHYAGIVRHQADILTKPFELEAFLTKVKIALAHSV